MAAPATEGGVSAFAPAKINLTLHVTGRRDDGYHTLDSLVVFAGIGDRITATPSDSLTLTVTGPRAGVLEGLAPEDNIVLRAARALADAAGIEPRAAITLYKRLPAGGGVGGGSSDAAAALRALVEAWEVTLPEPDLMALALRLGADVPVCLRGRPTQVSGIGEQLTDPPTLPPAWLLLVNPGVHQSTPEVFRARAGRFEAARPLERSPRDAADLAAMLADRRNGLTAAALSLAPEIGTVLAALAAAPGCLLARMSGSGSTCWGLYADGPACEAAALRLQAERPGWWVKAAPMLTDSPDS